MKLLSFLKTIVPTATVKTLNIIANIVMMVSAARILGVEQFGAFAFVLSLLLLWVNPISVGISSMLTKTTAVYNHQGRGTEVRSIAKWSSRTILVYSVLFMMVVLVALIFIPIAQDTVAKSALVVGAVLLPVLSLINPPGAILHGLGFTAWGQVPELASRVTTTALMWLYSFVSAEVTTTNFLSVYLIGCFVGAGLGQLLMQTRLPTPRPSSRPTDEISKWGASAKPFIYMSLALTMSSQIDVLLLGVLQDDSVVGLYRVAVQGATLVALSMVIINIALAPKVAGLFAKNDISNAQIYLYRGTTSMLLFSLLMILPLILFGIDILSVVFGDEYLGAIDALTILCIGQLLNALFGPVVLVLTMTGNEKAVTHSLLAATIINLILNLMLFPVYGIVGAALATAVANLSTNIYMAAYANKNLNLDTTFYIYKLLSRQEA